MCDSVWKCMWVCQFTDYLYFSKRSARRMVSQAVDLSGLTRLKNEFRSKYAALSYNTKGVYTVDILSWRNFRLPKGSRIPRPPCNMAQGGGFNLKSP